MNKFGSWKDRLSDSLNKIPNLDSMAKEDEYIHSSEFRVSKKKTANVASEHIYRSKETSKMVNKEKENNIKKTLLTSDGDIMSLNKDRRQNEQKELIKPARTSLEMSAMITPNSSTKMENKYNTMKATADIYDITKDSTVNTFHQSNSSEGPSNWSLLDIMEPETKSFEQSDDTNENSNHSEPIKNEEAKTEQKKNEFVGLMSVVEAIMTEKSTEKTEKSTEKSTESSMGKSNETKKNNFFDFDHIISADDYNANEDNAFIGKKNQRKEIITNIPHELHYESDSSHDSDLENDFVTRMHNNSKTQSDSKSFSVTDSSSLGSDNKDSYIHHTQSLADESSRTGDIIGKPVWFDVFDQTKENDIESDPLSVIKTKSNSTNNDTANGAFFGLSDSFISKKSKDDNKGFSFQFKSVSNTIAQKWKQHNVGAKLPLKSLFEPNSKTEQKSFEPLKLKTDTLLQINENEYVQKDSSSLFAQDDQAEWEKIKALTASTPLTRLIAFWEKHDNYVYLVFSFFLMTFVYFYVNHKTMLYGLT